MSENAVATTENPLNISAPAPLGHFQIERKAYLNFLGECKDGDMSYLRLLNKKEEVANVVFFGANYSSNYPMKNLYKALNIIKPDTLLV
jgi:hypothetical protein